MAVHKVSIRQPAKQVMHKDVAFIVQSDGVLLGELTVSKGSIDWRPANKQKAKKISWEKFAAMMEQL